MKADDVHERLLFFQRMILLKTNRERCSHKIKFLARINRCIGLTRSSFLQQQHGIKKKRCEKEEK